MNPRLHELEREIISAISGYFYCSFRVKLVLFVAENS